MEFNYKHLFFLWNMNKLLFHSKRELDKKENRLPPVCFFVEHSFQEDSDFNYSSMKKNLNMQLRLNVTPQPSLPCLVSGKCNGDEILKLGL